MIRVKPKRPYIYILPILFLITTSTLIIASGFYLLNESTKTQKASNQPAFYSLFASTPKVLGAITQHINYKPAQAEVIKQFMIKYHAPQELVDHSNTFVEMADKYEIAPWLTVAIGMCEGNLGKSTPKLDGKETYNTWGWAASEKDLAEKSGAYNLDSWESAIETVTKGLATSELYKPHTNKEEITFEDIENIMQFYAPPSVLKGGPWAKCVWQYYQELETFKSTF